MSSRESPISAGTLKPLTKAVPDSRFKFLPPRSGFQAGLRPCSRSKSCFSTAGASKKHSSYDQRWKQDARGRKRIFPQVTFPCGYNVKISLREYSFVSMAYAPGAFG